MPTFIRPRRVIVEESGGGLAVVVAAAAALALGAIAAVIDDIVITLAIAAAVAVAGSLAVLVWVLRRGRGTVTTAAPQLPVRARGIITAPARLAIEPRRVLPGAVISHAGHRDEAQR
jgi:Flp pilus assembly protein TadB